MLGGMELFSSQFYVALLSIIMIDLVLAGDNAVVIAMAVQSLPKKQKMQGILLGALAAVILRVIFTFFASQLLTISFVKLIGGIAILWIAVKLMAGAEGAGDKTKPASTVWSAVTTILIADVTMSIDNILAVAGASHGCLPLLLFGLGLSIPLVVFASSLISKAMEGFPIIMWLGALILGKVGGEMIVTDPFMVARVFTPLGLTELKNGVTATTHPAVWIAELAAAALIVAIAFAMRKTRLKPCAVISGEDDTSPAQQ